MVWVLDCLLYTSIWELGEVPDGKCPHCGSALVPNTVENGHYIEEGYLPQWKAYTEWLARTLNKKLTVLELGEGFGTPTVIRWPFEKTVFFNKKAWFYRVHHEFYQISEELKEKAEGVESESVSFICDLAECCREVDVYKRQGRNQSGKPGYSSSGNPDTQSDANKRGDGNPASQSPVQYSSSD